MSNLIFFCNNKQFHEINIINNDCIEIKDISSEIFDKLNLKEHVPEQLILIDRKNRYHYYIDILIPFMKYIELNHRDVIEFDVIIEEVKQLKINYNNIDKNTLSDCLYYHIICINNKFIKIIKITNILSKSNIVLINRIKANDKILYVSDIECIKKTYKNYHIII